MTDVQDVRLLIVLPINDIYIQGQVEDSQRRSNPSKKFLFADTRSPSEGERPVLVVPKFLRESFEMADRKASRSRPEKSKEAPGNAVSRFIQRLSPTKRYRGQENPGASSSSISQKTDSRSGKKDSSTTKNSSRKEYKHSEKLTKSSLNLLESSSSSKKSKNANPIK
ncbi:hypothetical protein KQX54_017246 [Cotesia glomerata]|uniref:Uncharacterized protein n=1 Tax=Cotesia glomerata TaxID=32391 RepID=A0AAV7ICQ6_COTGL|nr:hypothetical protein KQX54_017246 [Cotesia glomerata]